VFLNKTAAIFPLEQWRVLVIAVISCCSGVAFAQQSYGIFVGTVTDAAGAGLSGAKVTVTNTETQASPNGSDRWYR